MGKQATGTHPGQHEILAELDSLLSSSAFKTRGRSRAFLRFVVEESLAGRRERLKGYTLGVEVCGRPDDFDPQTDAIVRVEAGRLRKRMAHYYLTEGLDDPVLIRIPTGAYAPEFSYRAAGREKPKSDDQATPKPLPAPATEAPAGEALAARKPPLLPRVATLAPAAVLLAVFALGASHINRKLDLVLDRQAGITQGIASSDALEPASTTAPTAARTPPPAGSSIESETQALYRQATALRDPAFDPARSRLAELAYLRVIELDPEHAGAYAGLAYVLAFRSWWGLGEDRRDDARRARSLARTAVDKAPELGWAHLSLGLALAVSGEHAGAVVAAARATSIAPGNPHVHAFAGLIHLLAGDSDQAITLSHQAIHLDPLTGRAPYRNILGIALFHAGRHQEALAALLQNLERGGPDGPHMAYYRAAAYVRLGRHAEAGLELERVRSFGYRFDLTAALGPFRDPAAARQVTDSLRLAGWRPAGERASAVRLASLSARGTAP